MTYSVGHHSLAKLFDNSRNELEDIDLLSSKIVQEKRGEKFE